MTEDAKDVSSDTTVISTSDVIKRQEELREEYEKGLISEDDLAIRTDKLANQSFEYWEKNKKKK